MSINEGGVPPNMGVQLNLCPSPCLADEGRILVYKRACC